MEATLCWNAEQIAYHCLDWLRFESIKDCSHGACTCLASCQLQRVCFLYGVIVVCFDTLGGTLTNPGCGLS